MLKIAVFGSGRGSNFTALQNAIIKEKFDAQVVLVISNNSKSGVLETARSFNIPALHISQKQFQNEDTFNKKILELLREHDVNFIVLAGYMKKIDSSLTKVFHNRIINIHPALLPKFGGEGMFGKHVHEAVIAAKEKKSGATVHYVNDEYDRGAIIAQAKVDVEESDTAELLATKVLAIEHRLLPDVVKKFSENKI